IEQRILEKLYERIAVFERSIGELEMILGDELGTIERDILSKQLTMQEEERLIEQKARVIEARLKELETLEKKAAHFIGTDQYFDEEVDLIRKCRRYVTGEQMRRFVLDFIKTNCPRTQLDADPTNITGSLYPDDKLRDFLTRQGAASSLPNYLMSGDRGVLITFDSQKAFENPQMDFLNVLHPLPQSIVKHYKEAGGVQSNAQHIVLRTDLLNAGMYVFFIYRLSVRAARGSNTLEMVILDENCQTVCSVEDAEMLLGEMVEKGEEPKGALYEFHLSQLQKAVQVASEMFHNKADLIRSQVERNNDIFIDRRLESVRGWYNKNINMQRSLLEQAISKEREKRYIRMLEGTIRRLQSELVENEYRLNDQRKIGIEYNELAAGILEVR
ncbi:MAG: hypothetical protein LLG04_07210, partial [Parachlamydia sp.]|nr:hypothetical protein [Parachlamydia sp.]